MTGTNFFASSGLSPSLPKPPTTEVMSAALPPMAPASPPNNPPRPPPPEAGAFFRRSWSPGTLPSWLSNSAAPSLSFAAFNNTAAPPSACAAADAEGLRQAVDELFHEVSLSCARQS